MAHCATSLTHRRTAPGALALALLLGGCLNGGGQFTGIVNGSFFEPTGTVFAFADNLTPPPELAKRDKERLILVGVYAYFDPAQDQSVVPGTELEDLRQEIARNDWVSIEWTDRSVVEGGKNYTAVMLRDDEENYYRVADPNPPTPGDVTPDFLARVHFRRSPLRRNAPYDCPAYLPPPLCDGYRPMGSRLTAQVTVDSASFNDGGNVNTRITLRVDKRDGDPDNSWTGSISGTLNAVLVSERVAESNLDLLELYPLFKLDR